MSCWHTWSFLLRRDKLYDALSFYIAVCDAGRLGSSFLIWEQAADPIYGCDMTDLVAHLIGSSRE